MRWPPLKAPASATRGRRCDPCSDSHRPEAGATSGFLFPPPVSISANGGGLGRRRATVRRLLLHHPPRWIAASRKEASSPTLPRSRKCSRGREQERQTEMVAPASGRCEVHWDATANMSIARPLIVAFAFLTRLPVGSGKPEDADVGRAIAFFPIVGCTLGIALAAAAWLLGAFPRPHRHRPRHCSPPQPAASIWMGLQTCSTVSAVATAIGSGCSSSCATVASVLTVRLPCCSLCSQRCSP